jgi:predicted nucleotidyltransferase
MIALIENNIGLIKDVCKKHHVKSLSLFGSANDSIAFSEKSDVDFLYEIDTDNFKNWATGNYDYIDNLNGLESDLTILLQRKVDLVPFQNIRNRFFKESIDCNRQLIYDGT